VAERPIIRRILSGTARPLIHGSARLASSDLGLGSATGNETEPPAEFDESFSRQAAVSAALASIFRGKFCDLILPNRTTTTFDKHGLCLCTNSVEWSSTTAR